MIYTLPTLQILESVMISLTGYNEQFKYLGGMKIECDVNLKERYTTICITDENDELIDFALTKGWSFGDSNVLKKGGTHIMINVQYRGKMVYIPNDLEEILAKRYTRYYARVKYLDTNGKDRIITVNRGRPLNNRMILAELTAVQWINEEITVNRNYRFDMNFQVLAVWNCLE